MKIGVFGGSFDPPHLSHVAICSFALALTDVDVVMVVPCYEHALSKNLSAFEHRLEMCRLAFEDLRRVTVSAVEQELGGTSYTLRTLEHLRTAHDGAELALIVGADAMRDHSSWHRFDAIRAMAQLVVFARGGVECAAEVCLPAPPPMSATSIREMVRRGDAVDGLVPRRVLEYITHHELYGDGE